MKNLVLISSFLFMCLSCQNKASTEIDEPIIVKSEWEITIKQLAGETLDLEGFNQIPLIFNTGKILQKNKPDIETLILGKRFNNKRNMYVKPIGTFSFEKDTSLIEYVISVPTDETLNNLKINSYFDLNQKNHSTKYLVEDWFRGACNVGKCKNFDWGNELKALKRLE